MFNTILLAAAGYSINQPTSDSDEHIANTELLLQGEGSNGQNNNTFVDSSASSHTITRNGDTTQGSFSPFSPKGWSMYVDGTDTTQGIVGPTVSSILGTGTGNWTVEFWYRFDGLYTSGGTATAIPLIGNIYWYNGADGSFWMNVDSNQNVSVGVQHSPGTFGTSAILTSTTTLSAGSWYHIALVKQSNTGRLYINGTQEATVSLSNLSSSGFHATSNTLTVGRWYNIAGSAPSTTTYGKGYFSNVRVTSSAVYPDGTTFTPSTEPLTAITDCKLLTLQDNRYVDNSSLNSTITAYDGAAIKATSPFSDDRAYPKASYFSGKFDGSNDYLNCGSSSDFAFGTGDFTVEAWVYSNGTQSTAAGVFSIGSAGTDSGSWQLDANASAYTNKWGFVIGSHSSVTKVTSSSNIVHNQWTHLAVTRDASNVVRFFVNGVLNDSQTITNNLSTTGPLKIGTNRNPSFPSYFDGYISNARVIKGTALYTTTFTPPTAPLTPVTNTKLLTLQDNYLVDHSSSSHSITNNGGVTFVPESPFSNSTYPLSGTFYSGYVDGNNDTFEINNSTALNFGTGDFTMECWFNISSFGSQGSLCLWDNYNGAQGPRFNWLVNATGIGVDATSGMNMGSYTDYNSFNVQTNEWHHAACVRDSTGIKVYLDGVLRRHYTTSSTEAYTPTNQNPRIGDYSDNYVTGAGYISNFRVVKGKAVYTSDFTVPTEPLTAIEGTVLLTLQDGTLQDNSTSSHYISANGNATITEIAPFGVSLIDRAGSMQFDGSGDYLSWGASYLNGEFTWEVWVYPKHTDDRILFSDSGASNIQMFRLNYGSSGTITFYNGSYVFYQVDAGVQAFEWTHLALSRGSDNVTRLFVNGEQKATANNTYGWRPNKIGQFFFNGSASGNAFKGYMSNMRIVHGTQLYSSNFTPPTAPLQPITNTVLLLNGNNGGVEDSLGKVNLFTNGPAPEINTTVKKFGTGSIKFDGSNDWLLSKHDPGFNIESGDFTIEGWYYRIGTGRHSIINKRPSSGNSGFELRIEPSSVNNNPVFYFTGGSSFGTINYSVPSNQWVYIAVVRSGSNAALFVDGQREASSSSWADGTSNTGSLRFGHGTQVSNDYLNGYLDDFRLTKGVARYDPTLTTHTVPTTTHPTI
jgi:hypothetical protein